VSAVAAPLVLAGGFLFAGTLQPASYDPLADTISSLASYGATDPWVMTIAMAGLGLCYLMTAVGLRPARPRGRLALACGGLATLLLAVFRLPQDGYSEAHAVAVVVECVTMCLWPVLAAHRIHPAALLSFTPSVIGSMVMIGLVLWFALASNTGDVGLAERCAAVGCALWVPAVALTSQRGPDQGAIADETGELLGAPVADRALAEYDQGRRRSAFKV
jgi:hypothetical membrane protein